MFKKLFILAVLLMTSVVMTAQVTSADISGIVMAGDETAIGATITAKHIPSGSVYRGITNIDGRFIISGMRAGGPYEIDS